MKSNVGREGLFKKNKAYSSSTQSAVIQNS